MPDTTITALPTGNPLDGTEQIPADQGANTVKVSVQKLARYTWNHVPTHSMAIAGANPTIAECDTAMTALTVDKTDDRMFYIYDTAGANPKMWLCRYIQAADTYFAVKLSEVN